MSDKTKELQAVQHEEQGESDIDPKYWTSITTIKLSDMSSCPEKRLEAYFNQKIREWKDE